MNCSVSIQAHPSRPRQVRYLHRKLGNVPVAWDQIKNVWDTRKRALALHDPALGFHCVIQDDALICRDFYHHLDQLLIHGDQFIYCLFYRDKPGDAPPRPAMRAAAEAGFTGNSAGFFTFPRLQFGVGVVFPTWLFNPMIEYCDSIVGRTRNNDDMLMTQFLNERGILTLYPLPSLVDHRPEGRSLIGNGSNASRVAKWFIGE